MGSMERHKRDENKSSTSCPVLTRKLIQTSQTFSELALAVVFFLSAYSASSGHTGGISSTWMPPRFFKLWSG